MNRRTALTATAGALTALTGLAGCLGTRESVTGDESVTGESATDGSPSSTTPRETTPDGPAPLALGESAALSDGRSLTVAEPTVQVTTLWYNGAFSVVQREPGVQFLVVDVTGPGEAEPDPSAFCLEVDGERLDPAGRYDRVQPMGAGRESAGTLVAIPVPVRAVSSASVAYAPTFDSLARWRLDDATTAKLASRPDLRIRDVELAPVDPGVGLRLTVENAGDRDAVLRALVEPNWAYDISDPVAVLVSAGETVTEAVPAPSLGYGGETPTTDELRLRTDPRPLTRTFVVEYATTETPSST
jgi:hypothetical protein